MWFVWVTRALQSHLLYLVAREENANTPVKFTYTPLHGVGQKFAEAAFEVFNFPPLISVAEQVRDIRKASTQLHR